MGKYKTENVTLDNRLDESVRANFSRMVHAPYPVSEAVIFSAAENPDYFSNLLTAAGKEDYLIYLLNHPAKRTRSVTEDEAREFVTTWEKRLYHQRLRNAYYKSFGTYISAESKRHSAGDIYDEQGCKPSVGIHTEDFREVYLDHNSTTYLRPEVQTVMEDYAAGKYGFGNPGSTHPYGYLAMDYVIDSRIRIANCLNVPPKRVYFAGSGSQANNMAIKGIAFQYPDEKGHFITSKAEHASVLETMKYLEGIGFEVTYLDVDSDGIVNPDDVGRAVREDTRLVSIMTANNEIGSVNDIGRIGAVCRDHGVPFMTDAVQAFGKIPINPKESDISILTCSAHKIYGPKGIGAVYAEEGLSLVPLVHGGGQEFGMLSGTENVGHIVAFGKAAELAAAEMHEEHARLKQLQEYFLSEIGKIQPAYKLNGSAERRIPNNLSISFPGMDSGALVRSLGKAGICTAASSACASKNTETSHVLKAIGADAEHYGTIRFGLGLRTNKEDIHYVVRCLKEILLKLSY